jgi:hypothetical protein
MRSILRVGAPAAVLGCLVMYLTAHAAGLVVAPGVVALGIVTGLAMAKWLEWPWFGRQLEAGFKAGTVACIPAGLVGLLTLVVQGPHDLAQLAGISHLGSLSVARPVTSLGFGGWISADILGVVLAVALGVGAATLATMVTAWSKSARTVRKVAQAHEAAQALRRGSWGPASTAQVPSFPSSLSAGSAWQGLSSPSVPVPSPAAPWNGSTKPSLPPIVTATAQQPATRNPTPPPANTPTTDEELRAAMREALAMWGDDSGETAAVSVDASASGGDGSADADVGEQPTVRRKRNPKASQFLNDAKKKGRKKTDTRDWLC